MAALLPHTFLYLSILSFLCLSFPPRYLFFSLLPLTRQLLPSRLLRFCFPSHLCHRSLLQLVPQSHLSDTEMMGKNNKKIKQSEENQSYSRLSLFWRLTPACSLFFFFNSPCVRCSCAQRQWQRCRHRGSCQTVDSLSYSSSGPRPALFYQVPTLSWLDVDHLSKHEEDGGGMG